jgi:hypothetical protein
MQGLTVVASLVAIGYGYAVGGLFGALTGLVAALGVGSGLAITLAEGVTAVAARGATRQAQRLGGALSAGGCLAGALHGGWHFGWAWGVVGYLAGAVAALVVGLSLMITARYRSSNVEIRATRAQGPDFATDLPIRLDLNDAAHVALIDDVRVKYGDLLADSSHPYANCLFRPASLLPYPKPVISATLNALLDFAEGRRESKLLSQEFRSTEFADTLRATLVHLDDFLELSPEQLPTDRHENLRIGFEIRDIITKADSHS